MQKRAESRAKGLLHIALQNYLQVKLGRRETELEVPIPPVRRIADLVWHPANLVIEVQCSFLFPLDIQERTMDYRWAGKEVLWLLERSTFLEKRSMLKFIPHCFFSFDRAASRFLFFSSCCPEDPFPLIENLLAHSKQIPLAEPFPPPFCFCPFLKIKNNIL